MIELDHDVYEELLEPLLKDSPIQTNVVEDNNNDPDAPI
jgi:hypothetical protein